jgi:PAS domain S-box-containing protein
MPTSLDLAGRLSAVVALQQEILGVASDIEKVMQRVVSLTPGLTNGTGAVIELVEGDDLVYRAASGPAAEHIGKRVKFAGSLSGEAVRKREVMRCDDTDTDARVDRAACRAIGIRSMIVAPLMDGTHAIGGLKTYATRAGAFDDLDTYTIQLLAGMTSSALMLAEQFRNREQSEQRYRMLFERNVAGVFRTTDDGRILDCNDALVETLGYSSREDLLTHQVWDLYPDRDHREAFLTSLRNNQTLKNLRLHLKKKDGTPLTGIINVSVVAADGEEFQLLGTLVEE